jgi:hypothetical protein
MATFINENQKLHIFSKSPVLGPDKNGIVPKFNYSVNKSGHTITLNEVRSSDIPSFIFVGSEDKISIYAKNPIHNDIVYWNSLKAGDVQLKRWNAKAKRWEDYTSEFNQSNFLKNKDDKEVVKIHRKKAVISITADNNAGAGSNNWSVFVNGDNGNRLTHFIAPTDKLQDGLPSLGYAPIVYINGEATDESTEDDGYIANTYAGIIQFNKERTDLNLITVTAYEYIGDYLDKSLTDITTTEFLDTAWGEDNGVKVSLSGNVFNPTIEVSANFSNDVTNDLTNNRTDLAVSVSGLKNYIDNTNITETTDNENGVTVTLNGTISAPTIDITVNTEDNIANAISNNKGNNVVSANAVKNYYDNNKGVTKVSATNKYLTVTNPTTTPSINAEVYDDILIWSDTVAASNVNYTTWQQKHAYKLATADAVRSTFEDHEVYAPEGYKFHVYKEDRIKWDGHVADNDVHVSSADREAWHRVAQNIDDLDSITTVAIIKSGAFTNYGNSEFTDIPVLPCLCLAQGAFLNSRNLDTFICDMPNLADGTEMFKGCSNLIKFESCINNIAKAERMFENCEKLVTVNLSKNSLSGLSHAAGMFAGCYELKNFKGDLSFLNDGTDMFRGCKLNMDSLCNIAYSIKSWDDNNTHNITIGLDPSINIEGEASSLIEEIESKGWSITYNG